MLLAIDTATDILSVALHDGAETLAETTLIAGRRHSALLAPLIQRTLAEAEAGMSALTALAASVGPGSYTGLRIGVALAKGMAAAQDLPLVPVTTLETLLAAQPRAGAPLIAAVSAGRRRVIWAEYAGDAAGWRERRAPAIGDWEAIVATVEAPLRVTGEVSREALASLEAARASGLPIDVLPAAARLRRASWLAEEAWRRLRETNDRGAFAADKAAPVYLKRP